MSKDYSQFNFNVDEEDISMLQNHDKKFKTYKNPKSKWEEKYGCGFWKKPNEKTGGKS
tara:strand:- start:249 stop:422 length:174 start_codon:yes stop_codon:yes gene_type:complete